MRDVTITMKPTHCRAYITALQKVIDESGTDMFKANMIDWISNLKAQLTVAYTSEEIDQHLRGNEKVQ